MGYLGFGLPLKEISFLLLNFLCEIFYTFFPSIFKFVQQPVMEVEWIFVYIHRMFKHQGEIFSFPCSHGCFHCLFFLLIKSLIEFFFGLLRVWTSSQRCAATGSGMTTYYVSYLITLLSLLCLRQNQILLLLHITSLLYLYMCLFAFRIFLLLLQIIFGKTC